METKTRWIQKGLGFLMIILIGWTSIHLPGDIEAIRQLIWVDTAIMGVLASILFLVRQKWPALMASLAAEIILLLFLNIHFSIWLWIVLDVVLAGSLVWAWFSGRRSKAPAQSYKMRWF